MTKIGFQLWPLWNKQHVKVPFWNASGTNNMLIFRSGKNIEKKTKIGTFPTPDLTTKPVGNRKGDI